jgi:hypothetical protein
VSSQELKSSYGAGSNTVGGGSSVSRPLLRSSWVRTRSEQGIRTRPQEQAPKMVSNALFELNPPSSPTSDSVIATKEFRCQTTRSALRTTQVSPNTNPNPF